MQSYYLILNISYDVLLNEVLFLQTDMAMRMQQGNAVHTI